MNTLRMQQAACIPSFPANLCKNLNGAQENETVQSDIDKPNMKSHLTEESEKE